MTSPASGGTPSPRCQSTRNPTPSRSPVWAGEAVSVCGTVDSVTDPMARRGTDPHGRAGSFFVYWACARENPKSRSPANTNLNRVPRTERYRTRSFALAAHKYQSSGGPCQSARVPDGQKQLTIVSRDLWPYSASRLWANISAWHRWDIFLAYLGVATAWMIYETAKQDLVGCEEPTGALWIEMRWEW